MFGVHILLNTNGQ